METEVKAAPAADAADADGVGVGVGLGGERVAELPPPDAGGGATFKKLDGAKTRHYRHHAGEIKVSFSFAFF